jgi:hypothetical protein
MESKTEQENLRLVPPKEMFEASALPVAPVHGIAKGQLTTPVYRVELPPEGGILSWHEGDRFPVKSWPFKEAIFAIDTIKRAIINIARLLTSSPLRYFAALFLILPRAVKRGIVRKALELFTDYTSLVFNRWGQVIPMQDEKGNEFGLHGLSWKPQFYCDMVREFRRVALTIAGDDPVNQALVRDISMLLEFDDAYRYIIQDAFGEIDPLAVKEDPAKEVSRVISIVIERGRGTSEKFEQFAKLLPPLFMIRDFRELVDRFFAEIDLKKMSLDEIDFYRCLLWGGYRFKGMGSDQERISLRLMIDEEWQLKERLQNKNA